MAQLLTDPITGGRGPRNIEAYLSGPVSGVTTRVATRVAYYNGNWFDRGLAVFPSPSDNSANDFGVQSGGGFTAEIAAVTEAALSTPSAAFYTLASNIIGQVWELSLVSTLTKPDGTTQTITDTRRATAKTARIVDNVLRVEFEDVELDSLNGLYPSKTYTVADFSTLFSDHVGRPIADGIGQLVKIPMTWIRRATGDWRYGFLEQRAGMTYTLQTVYRSTSENQVGAIVSASEYTVGTTTGASSGVVVNSIRFAREQLTTNGAPYYFMCDVLVSAGTGTTDQRLASREISRMLTIAGVTPNTTSFNAAHTLCDSLAMRIDAGYVQQRTLRAIIEDLLAACRGVISKNTTGEWLLVQDQARSADASYNTIDDQISVDSVEYQDKPSRVEFFYGVRRSGTEEWLTTPVVRATGGTLPVKRYQNPYVRDFALADRLCDYLSKRDSIKRRAQATIHAVQLETRERVTITNNLHWGGAADWLIERVQRPEDKNVLTLREYDATIYTYTSSSAPSGASSVYTPDYSFTTPAAPTGLTYNSGASGVTFATDGVTRAYMAYSVTPPTVNYSRIVFDAIDPIGGITRVEGKQNGSVFEAVIAGLRPGVTHTIQAYAINATGISGQVASESRAAPGSAATPGTVTMNSTGQIGTTTVQFAFNPRPASEAIDYYEAQISSNLGASWGAAFKVSNPFEYNFGSGGVGGTYGARVRAVDKFGVAGAYSSGFYIATSAWAGAPVIQTSAINQGRANTTTGSIATATLAVGASANVAIDVFCFFPSLTTPIGSSNAIFLRSSVVTKVGVADIARFAFTNNHATDTGRVDIDYRIFNP